MEAGLIAEVNADGVIVGRSEELHRFNRLAFCLTKLDKAAVREASGSGSLRWLSRFC